MAESGPDRMDSVALLPHPCGAHSLRSCVCRRAKLASDRNCDPRHRRLGAIQTPNQSAARSRQNWTTLVGGSFVQ